jgi:hypothetical protein
VKAHEVRALRTQVVGLEKAEGRYALAKRLGIAPATLRAFVSGAPCRPGTVAQIAQGVNGPTKGKPPVSPPKDA